MNHEGKNLRYVHNRIFRRFKKHFKAENDELMLRAAESMCTVANTSRRIVEGARYETRLGEIEAILKLIKPEEIARAKALIGV